MDLGTLLGLVLSMGMLAYAIMFHGGSLQAFVDVPSILIVIIGTLCVTMTSFSLAEFFRTGSVIFKAFIHSQPDPSEESVRMLKLAQKARQSGLLGIQRDAQAEPNMYLRTGLLLSVDGVNPVHIESILKADTAAMLERHSVGVSILKRASDVAPAMGLVGTLIGLVQMLGNLSDPAAIGPAMAIAILGTFYGAVMSYMLLSPLAAKLERVSQAEFLSRKIHAATAMSIARQENPRQLELQLNAILPPSKRVAVFRS